MFSSIAFFEDHATLRRSAVLEVLRVCESRICIVLKALYQCTLALL